MANFSSKMSRNWRKKNIFFFSLSSCRSYWDSSFWYVVLKVVQLYSKNRKACGFQHFLRKFMTVLIFHLYYQLFFFFLLKFSLTQCLDIIVSYKSSKSPKEFGRTGGGVQETIDGMPGVIWCQWVSGGKNRWSNHKDLRKCEKGGCEL